MARPLRGQNSGYAYHVLNRGNGGALVFHTDGDYQAFLHLLTTAKTKFPVHVFGFCLMPNHFHLVLQPGTDQALSAFMHWWQTSHARRYHLHYGSHGHLWQGRYKSFPIQQDAHLLTVLRYVLRNPLRAGLVQRSADWPWSSHAHPTVIDPWPIDVPPNWSEWVDAPQFDHELARLRTCVTRQAPFGTPAWQEQTAKALGLDSTLRPPGRPRKTPRENGA